MRPEIRFPALLLILLCLLASPAQSTEADSRAVEIAHRTMDAMGGRAAFEATRLLRFDFVVRQGESERPAYRHWWDRWTGEYRLEGRTGDGEPFRVLFDVDTRKGEAWIGERKLEGEERDEMLERAYHRFINDSYWLLMPWKWLDPGVRLVYEGEHTIDGEVFDVVELTFEDEVGITSGDRYRGFVSRDTALMERWEFVLQQEDGSPGEGPPSAFAWEEWEETEAGILLSTVKPSLKPGSDAAITFPVVKAVADASDELARSWVRPSEPLSSEVGDGGS